MKTIDDLQAKVKEVAIGLAAGVEVMSEVQATRLSKLVDEMVLVKKQIEKKQGYNFKPILSTVSCNNTGHNLLTRLLDCDNLPNRTKELLVKCLDAKLFAPNIANSKTGEFPIDLVIKKQNGDFGLLKALFKSGAKIGKYINVHIKYQINHIVTGNSRNLTVLGSLEMNKVLYLTEIGKENSEGGLYEFLYSDELKSIFPLVARNEENIMVSIKSIDNIHFQDGERIMRVNYSVNFKPEDIISKCNSNKRLVSFDWRKIDIFFNNIDPRFLDPNDENKQVVTISCDDLKLYNNLECVMNPKVKRVAQEKSSGHSKLSNV